MTLFNGPVYSTTDPQATHRSLTAGRNCCPPRAFRRVPMSRGLWRQRDILWQGEHATRVRPLNDHTGDNLWHFTVLTWSLNDCSSEICPYVTFLNYACTYLSLSLQGNGFMLTVTEWDIRITYGSSSSPTPPPKKAPTTHPVATQACRKPAVPRQQYHCRLHTKPAVIRMDITAGS